MSEPVKADNSVRGASRPPSPRARPNACLHTEPTVWLALYYEDLGVGVVNHQNVTKRKDFPRKTGRRCLQVLQERTRASL